MKPKRFNMPKSNNNYRLSMCALFPMIILSVILNSCFKHTYEDALSKAGFEIAPASVKQMEFERFEKATEISCANIPELYNTTNLKKGSMVQMKWSNKDIPNNYYYFTETLQDIVSSEKGDVYVIDSAPIETGDVSPSNDTVIGTGSKVIGHGLSLFRDSYSLMGIVGRAADSYMYNKERPEREKKQVNQMGKLVNTYKEVRGNMLRKGGIYFCENDKTKNPNVQVKIIDFKLISKGNLTIALKSVPVNVYQIDSMILFEKSSINPNNFIMKFSYKLWVSDAVPFGIVKRKIKMTFLTPHRNNTLLIHSVFSNSEVTDFRY